MVKQDSSHKWDKASQKLYASLDMLLMPYARLDVFDAMWLSAPNTEPLGFESFLDFGTADRGLQTCIYVKGAWKERPL